MSDSHDSHSHGGHSHSHGPAPEPAAGPKPGGWWFWPALIGALLIGGIWWYLNQTHEVKEAHQTLKAAEGVVASAGDAAKSAWAALGEFFKRKLANGTELSIPRLGVESRLVDFIEDAAKPVDKTTWFDFDRLLFDTGSATLQAASQEQLGNIAAVLKAYPNVELKIGGYTDNTGDKAANVKLSGDRAKSVAAELAKLGIAAARLAPEGYGEEHPVADNSTEEGRAKNRRISMRVTKK